MFTELVIQVRRFPVQIQDQETGEILEDTVVLTKEHLHACQLVGQSSKELIQRLYAHKGVDVLDIGKADKREIGIHLEELYNDHCRKQVAD